jgi:membrane protein
MAADLAKRSARMQVATDLMWKRLCGAHLVKKVDLLGTYATALAYSFVLSVIPLLVVAFAMINETVGSLNTHTYKATLESVLPVESEQSVTNIIKAVETTWHGGLAKTIGLLFAIYTSFNLMNQIVRTLLFIFDDTSRIFEWNWRVFIKTVALLAVWTFLLLAIIVSSILTFVVHKTALPWTVPWKLTSDLIMIAALFAAVFITYYLVPGKRPPARDVRNGAMFASLGWIGSSLIFGRVLPYVFGANMVYQALGSVVIILLWAQSCAWSLILGACWMVRFPTLIKNRATGR